MNPIILDVETTISNKGNPFDVRNKLCYTGIRTESNTRIFNHQSDLDIRENLQQIIQGYDYLVAFNAKFDCHWLERFGIDIRHLRIWDCQYAEFLFTNQLQKYPALEDTAEKYGLGKKVDVVKEEYWNKGIDTLDIPADIMVQYLYQDLELTYKLFLIQQEMFATTHKDMWRLFQLHMEDQVVLREMERNGIIYDVESSLKQAKEVQTKISGVEKLFDVPSWFNFNSGDHLSAYLYGGTICIDTRIPIGVYKSGAKVGQPRYKILTEEYKFPRLFEPLPKSELKKEGVYATDEQTLSKLRGDREAKKRIGLLDQRSKLEKLRGTYFEGWPKIIESMAWECNTVHSTLNQCVAVTGRLSSTKPNQQNKPPECDQLCISRFN